MKRPLAHECHFAAKYTRFVVAKWLPTFHALRSNVLQPKRHFEGCFAAAKPPFGTRVPLRSVVRPFPSCEIDAKILSLRKRLATVKSMPYRYEKSPLLRKGTVTLGVPFKRYKFHFFYFKPSFELQKGAKRSQAKAPSRLPPPLKQVAGISDRFHQHRHGQNTRSKVFVPINSPENPKRRASPRFHL